MEEVVTLKFWHGGMFCLNKHGELRYLGGEGRTFMVDPDELCGFYLKELGQKCGDYDLLSFYYLIPGLSLAEGLIKVFDDEEVRKMTELVKASRCIDLFVYHMGDCPELLCKEKIGTQTGENNPNIQAQSPTHKRPKKLTPKRKAPVPQEQTKKSPRLIDSPQNKSKEHNHPSHVPTYSTKKKKKLTPHKDSTQQHINTSQKHLTHVESDSLNTKSLLSTSHNIEKQPHNSFKQPQVENTSDFSRTSVPEDYEWEDQCTSPIPWLDLIHPEHSDYSASTDSEFNPDDHSDAESDGSGAWQEDLVHEDSEGDEGGEGGQCSGEVDGFEAEDEADLNESLAEEVETSDDEFNEARVKVKGFTQNLLQLAKKLEKDAKEGKLGTQVQGETTNNIDDVLSEDNLDTPPNSGDEEAKERRLSRKLLVGKNTDFSTFQWRVGHRFGTRKEFKEAVAKYALLQGRNVFIHISDKKRGQRLGVRCANGCPFRLWASWDARRFTYVVKTVISEHRCSRNMERNKQCKSSWMAEQLLEVFKARPHWPAKEIIECIRQAYLVTVKIDFAYKVKYRAHRLLHGSMTEHYAKVGRYVVALKAASPGSDVELVTYKKKGSSKPVFQRLYMCFEGVKKGWTEGCRRIIAVDACFLKTFLGGQLMSAVGRDGNDQMYPIAWAAVEGENNLSWEWFFTRVQHSLGLDKGEGLVIVSDEHQMKLIFNLESLGWPNECNGVG